MKWIPSEDITKSWDQLPGIGFGAFVLGLYKGYSPQLVYYQPCIGKWMSQYGKPYDAKDITHWLPIPKLSEETENDQA